MRPDEGGCADLRRSLTAHTKLVRSPTYAPARSGRPRSGGVGRSRAQGAFRPPSRRSGAVRADAPTGATLPGGPPGCGTAPSPGTPPPRATPADPVDLGRNRPVRAPARPVRAPARPVRATATRCHRRPARSGHPVKVSPGGYRGYRAAGPHCREVKSRHGDGDRANRPSLPLDATASPEFPGIRGEFERTARGPWNRAQRQHSAIGALSYDTYARTAALISHGDDVSRGPACTCA